MGKQFWKQPADQIDGPLPDAPYWRKSCDICGDKGIYYFRKKVVCRAHRGALQADLEDASIRLEARFGKYKGSRAFYGCEWRLGEKG